MAIAEHYDIVIVGGGIVGAALAAALARRSLRIVVIENTLPTPPQSDYELRVSALSLASQSILHALGVWNTVQTQRCSPYREMRVWDAQGWGEIHFDCAILGQAQLGWIVENASLQYALWQRLETYTDLSLICPGQIEAAEFHSDCVTVTLADQRTINTRLLIGADGGRSKVRQLAAIECMHRAYDQRAVVATVATEYPHQDTAWQRFLTTGPLAFLPLNNQHCSIVWSTTLEQAETLLTLDDHAFQQTLGEAFEHRLGAITASSARAGFPLHIQHAHDYVKPRLALLGDAAHVVHPLAGQGVNLGLLDAACLAEVLLDADAKRNDIGSMKVLRRYERWRKGENALMLTALDGIHKLFNSRFAPLRFARNFGLNFTDAVEPLKQLFARRAMGLSGDLPMLARRSL